MGTLQEDEQVRNTMPEVPSFWSWHSELLHDNPGVPTVGVDTRTTLAQLKRSVVTAEDYHPGTDAKCPARNGFIEIRKKASGPKKQWNVQPVPNFFHSQCQQAPFPSGQNRHQHQEELTQSTKTQRVEQPRVRRSGSTP